MSLIKLVRYECATFESNETLPLHVNVLLTRVQVTFLVLELFLEIWLESALEVLCQDFLVQFQSMLNLCHIFEVDSVWNSKALHFVGMSPLLEVFFEGSATPVAGAATDLTLEFLAQAVQLKQPVRDWFSIPAHGQVLRVVLNTVVLVVRINSCALVCQQLLRIVNVFLCLNFLVA